MARRKYERMIASILTAVLAVGGRFRQEAPDLSPGRKKQRPGQPGRKASALRGFLPIIRRSAQAIRRLTTGGAR